MSEHQAHAHGHNGNGHDTHHANQAAESTETQVAELQVEGPLFLDKEYKFSFKQQKVTNELTGEEEKRPPVTLTLPIPTFDGLVASMADKKVIAFVLDLVEEAIKDQAREQLSDAEKPVNRQEDLDTSKLTLSYIANLTKSARTGSGISKETWADWSKDYIETMVPLRANDANPQERVTKAANIFSAKLLPVRSDKKALKFLRDQLAIWAQNTKNLEDFADVYKYLDERATDLINKDDVNLLAAL